MRILYVADPFLPVPPTFYGGVERVIASLMREAQARGNEVALAGHPASQIDDAPLYPLTGEAQPSSGDTFRNMGRLKSAVENFRPDLIHSSARLAYLSTLSKRTPKIMTFHREPTPWTVRLAARLHGKSLAFTGCSKSITLRGRAHGGNWTAVASGIDLHRYLFEPKTAPDAPLVFLSRIEPVKGAHHALAAARAAGRPLILAGNRDADSPYWKNEIAPHLGRNGISYIGPLDDRQKSEFLGQAAALLVPIGWEEPFGLVFTEALACGTPVISFRRGALPEIVEHGRHGFLCHDPSELPAAIKKISLIDRADCRRRVEERFTSSLMFERYEKLYQRLASPH